MISSFSPARAVLTFLALGFSVYFVARALWWTVQPSAPWLLIAALVVFIVCMVAIILWEKPGTTTMPLPAAVGAFIAGGAIPILANSALTPGTRAEPFATWYIGAVGLLAVVCVVRRRAVVGWLMILVLVVATISFLGWTLAIQLGLVGSCVWTLVAQLLVWFGDRAGRDVDQLTEVQQRVSAWRESQRARQYERRVRTQFALATAGPILMRTVETAGVLDDDERLVARLAEGRLRDELRGASLLSAHVREVIEAARRRGAVISVFDEGGLEGIDEERRAQIREELAAVIERSTSPRLIIRARRDDTLAVTVVGRVDVVTDEASAVDLWHEIPRAAG